MGKPTDRQMLKDEIKSLHARADHIRQDNVVIERDQLTQARGQLSNCLSSFALAALMAGGTGYVSYKYFSELDQKGKDEVRAVAVEKCRRTAGTENIQVSPENLKLCESVSYVQELKDRNSADNSLGAVFGFVCLLGTIGTAVLATGSKLSFDRIADVKDARQRNIRAINDDTAQARVLEGFLGKLEAK